MTLSSLSPDDLPPQNLTEADAALLRQLELSTRQHFFQACDSLAQSLLMESGWTICIVEVLTLVIHCPDMTCNWRILNHIAAIADSLAQFSPRAKIRVYPPSGLEAPFDMRVDERSVYRDQP